ncbi:MAG: YegS/Rv2252/BmrU family lipid kinase [Kamptonema sp. SIO4C4]|nr:YegS/Rv2252/BmrU family lipid kinase [Kamptonema sp. SIO4C4]
MSSSSCLIFNPAAGPTDADTCLKEIQAQLSADFSLTVYETTPDRDAEELAQDAIAAGFSRLFAAGGDGTVSGVAHAVLGTAIPLGIIPTGTANAFANALGIPNAIAPACQIIRQQHTRQVDVGRCNGKAMVLFTSIGFGAEMSHHANREAKDRWGIMAYFIAALQNFQAFDTFQVQLTADGHSLDLEATAITIANTAPLTSLLAQGPDQLIADDGLFDVTIIAPQDWTDPLSKFTQGLAISHDLLQSAIRQQTAQRDDITCFRAKQIGVKTHPPQKVMLDGEVIGTTPAEVHCVSQGLKLYIDSSHP